MSALCTIALFVLGLVGLFYLFWLVHLSLDCCCVWHARRYGSRRGLEVRRQRATMAFNASGKTEYTIVELDCVDTGGQRRLLRLVVWVFGVREALFDGKYPDSHEWA